MTDNFSKHNLKLMSYTRTQIVGSLEVLSVEIKYDNKVVISLTVLCSFKIHQLIAL